MMNKVIKIDWNKEEDINWLPEKVYMSRRPDGTRSCKICRGTSENFR